MKKTLIALAAASLCCGAASAASVTLYGIADLGLTYNHYDHKGDAGKSHTFSMESGQKNGSRWGLKGVEELGDGWTVGFVLEGGFNADDGTIGQNSRVFGRESQIFIDGPYGKIGFGRVGAISTDAGSYGLSDKINSFGTGWGNDQVIGSSHTVFASKPLRLDNSITYVSPEFYGLKLHAQYSMKNDSKADGTENKSDSDRYGALAATYQNGNFEALVLVDWLNKARP
ncbi:MAG: porin, partial [Duodenibacillus sp.]|nr:porin [Duodenibacillus sp.]